MRKQLFFAAVGGGTVIAGGRLARRYRHDLDGARARLAAADRTAISTAFGAVEYRLGLLDFGATGRLDTLEQASVAGMLIAIRRRDPAQLRDAVLEVATVRKPLDERGLERARPVHIPPFRPGSHPDRRDAHRTAPDLPPPAGAQAVARKQWRGHQ